MSRFSRVSSDETLDSRHTREWLRRYQYVRQVSETLCRPLCTEDYVIQSMEDVSPPKWHLAHTSWFFEAFILRPFATDYRPLDSAYDFLFNSYYETYRTPYPRPRRGLISRPGVKDIYRYRAYVDQAMSELLMALPPQSAEEILLRLALGLHHEQQHQELLVMDIKHILAQNPLCPVYRDDLPKPPQAQSAELDWFHYSAGIRSIGSDSTEEGFAFDNETPRHRQFVEAFDLAGRPVTNAEFLAFMQDDGYERPELWLSDGWRLIQQQGWQAPLYWQQREGQWHVMGLRGLMAPDWQAPVCHVSFFEADAYARWAGARLPSEAEWEIAASGADAQGDLQEKEANLLERDYLQPVAGRGASDAPRQLLGDVWEWTGSAYRPYPGFKPLPGSLGEYNGKFMSGQMVLRGGCCATPQGHWRPTYRNFFPPQARWAFSGLRLAREAQA